jgi:hypothetical protein
MSANAMLLMTHVTYYHFINRKLDLLESFPRSFEDFDMQYMINENYDDKLVSFEAMVHAENNHSGLPPMAKHINSKSFFSSGK